MDKRSFALYILHTLFDLLRDGGLFHDCMCAFMFPLSMFDFVLPVVSSVVNFFISTCVSVC